MKLLAVIGMMGIITTGIGAKGAEAPALYPNVGIVTEVDTESDTVYWSDGNDEWFFHGIEDWMVGNPRYINLDGMTEYR